MRKRLTPLLVLLFMGLHAEKLIGFDFEHQPGPPAIGGRERWFEQIQGENLALGKEVTFSKLPSYRLTQDANDSLDLTSGKLSIRMDDRIWFDRAAVGWTNADSGVNLTIDLGEKQPVGQIVIRLLGGKEQDSLVFPSEVTVVGSNDGKNFFKLAERRKVTTGEKELAENNPEVFFFIPETGVAMTEAFVFPIHCQVRYLGLSLKSPTGLLFTDQIAIIKDKDPANCKEVSEANPVQFLTSGVSIQPNQDILSISTNIVTPNFFRISDSRKEQDGKSVRFLFDLPLGVSLTMGPTGTATRKEGGENKNQWIIDNIYKGKNTETPFGPFYFTVEKGCEIPKGATASFSVDRVDSVSNTVVRPVVTVEIPTVPKIEDWDISLGWFVEGYQYTYPDFLNTFRGLGFNAVSTFPRNHTTPESQKKLSEYLSSARAQGFKVVANESPFHVMWSQYKNNPEIKNQLKGKEGIYACPTYTGEYYQKELERVANNAKMVHPDFVFFDIEFWYYPAIEAKSCTRCNEAFKQSKLEDWDTFLQNQGARMGEDLRKAVSLSAPGEKDPLIGMYNTTVEPPVYQIVHNFDKDYPGFVQIAMPSLYVQGNARIVHDSVRANSLKLGPRKVIPWLTAGTYGEFPPYKVEQMILEALLNGARGITYYTFEDFDPMDFFYHARALGLVAPYQKMLKEGKLIPISGSNSKLVFSAMGNDKEALVLIGNYGNSTGADTSVQLEGKEIKAIYDVQEKVSVELGDFHNVAIPSNGHRLFRVEF